MNLGDSLFYSSGFIILQEVKSTTDSLPVELFGKNGSLQEARLKIHSKPVQFIQWHQNWLLPKAKY